VVILQHISAHNLIFGLPELLEDSFKLYHRPLQFEDGSTAENGWLGEGVGVLKALVAEPGYVEGVLLLLPYPFPGKAAEAPLLALVLARSARSSVAPWA
jgi:hypothetical protein